MRNNEWNPENISDQSGTVVVVTGSSSGIGYETARVLANKHAEVIIAVRNLEKGHAAAQKDCKPAPEGECQSHETRLGRSLVGQALR